MQYISLEEVLAIHSEVVKDFGGNGGIRDFGLLHSAIERPKSSFAGNDLYKGVFSKAASLLHSLIFNHAFVDGNKRTAYVATARFLKINEYDLIVTAEEVVAYIIFIISDKPGIEETAAWLKTHSKKLN